MEGTGKNMRKWFPRGGASMSMKIKQTDSLTVERNSVLLDMHTKEFKAEMLYGYNSEHRQEITREIKEYSKNFHYDIMAIGINAMKKIYPYKKPSFVLDI
jgi:hypothetical protein